MSTVKTKNVQIGADGTASNNFTIYQPSTPDGTSRWAVGVSGSTTADVVTVNNSGNVGIGTASPSDGGGFGKCVDGNSSTGFGYYARGNSSTNYFALGWSSNNGYLNLRNSGNIILGTNDTERMRIDSSGNVLVGTTSANIYNATTGSGINLEAGSNTSIARSGLGVALNINKTDYTSGTTYFMQFTVNNSEKGTISSNGSTTSYTTTSDYRLKENIVPMVGALETVNKLKPVTYTWKESGVSSQGFIAHELQAVVSDAVTGEKDAIDEEGKPIYQGVDTSFLVATLTAAIQELTKRVQELEAKVN